MRKSEQKNARNGFYAYLMPSGCKVYYLHENAAEAPARKRSVAALESAKARLRQPSAKNLRNALKVRRPAIAPKKDFALDQLDSGCVLYTLKLVAALEPQCYELQESPRDCA